MGNLEVASFLAVVLDEAKMIPGRAAGLSNWIYTMQGTREDFQNLSAELSVAHEATEEFPAHIRELVAGFERAAKLLKRSNAEDIKRTLLRMCESFRDWNETGFTPSMRNLSGVLETLIEFTDDEARARSFVEN